MNIWGKMQNNQSKNNNKGEFLNITFYFKGEPIQIQSTSNVRFCILYIIIFTVKAGNPKTLPSFYLNKVRIDSTKIKTLKELNIFNKATVQVADDSKDNNSSEFLNIIFNCQGKSVIV